MKGKVSPFPPGSLFFAPMEGLTDHHFRQTIMKLYPQWSFFMTDFLRVPTVGSISKNKIIQHIGKNIYLDSEARNKTILQILTTPKAQTEETVKIINSLKLDHLNLNLGCPSKRVTAHKGGSHLLTDTLALRKIVKIIKKNFSRTFSVKMRIGYLDDSNFIEILKMLEAEGVDAIFIHARTKSQLYKGLSDWNYFSKAADAISIPIIANGDILTIENIQTLFSSFKCHSVMIGRGAIKKPWLAACYKNTPLNFNQEESIADILHSLEASYSETIPYDHLLLTRLKSFCQYFFDENVATKKLFLRSKTMAEFKYYTSLLKEKNKSLQKQDYPLM